MITWTLETKSYEAYCEGWDSDLDTNYYYNEKDFVEALLKELESGRVVTYAEKCVSEED